MNEVDVNQPFDLLLVERLATELQLRIGTLPRVEVYCLHVEAYPGDVLQCLRVQPRSFAEISRTVRAAKTMKLSVRGMGQASGSEKVLYADRYTVIVDCCHLNDEPRMELVTIHRDGDNKTTPGLRVLAGVTIDELVNFMIDRSVELYQSPDMIPGIGTIVGNILTASPGVYAPVSGALGGCLADEVITMRVVDSNGNLVEYSDPHKLEQYCAHLGLLGVVYDVVLRYREMSSSLVEYEFKTWCETITTESIKYSFRTNDLTEIIYVPYNHLREEQHLRHDWVPFQDEVIIRSAKRLPLVYAEDLDSAPRHLFHIIDPFTGPDQREIVSRPEEGPHLLGRAYRVLKPKLRNASLESQFTPWSMTCLAPPPSPLRMIRFAVETSCTLDPFFRFIRTMLEALMYMVRNEEGEEARYGLNLVVRVNFTGANRSAKILGTGSLNPTEEAGRRLLAHITLTHLVRPCNSEDWCDLARRFTNFTFTFIPRATLHWKSEWHTLEQLIKHIHEKTAPRTGPLRFQMCRVDREGMFMTERLQQMFFSSCNVKQRKYRMERERFLRDDLDVVDIPYRSFCQCEVHAVFT